MTPRVFCIGRNYDAHVREMGAGLPSEPVVFMKPSTCLVAPGAEIPFPRHGADLQHEVELVVAIGPEGVGWDRVAGIALGLDLTLRDVQARLKGAGLPWERAKAFESSAPLAALTAPPPNPAERRFRFECRVNGELRQEGDTDEMLFDVPTLLEAIGSVWRLREGDIVFTGTPSGVGPLLPGDRVTVAGSPGLEPGTWTIASDP